MNRLKKITAYITLAVILFSAGIFIGAGQPDFHIGKSMEIFFNLFRDVNTMYVDEVDADRLLTAGLNAMLEELDPYTEYIPESAMEDFEITITGKYGGVGSTIRKTDSGIVEIAGIHKGFPADKAGLHIGDKILAVDGKETRVISINEVSSAMKGTPGSKVTMLIEDLRTGKPREVVITRERIAVSGVSYYGLTGDGVGYISLDDFTDGCSDDVRNALLHLQNKRDLKGLIIDVRNNGGGLMEEAVRIVSLFVPKGTEVVSLKGRIKGSNETHKTTTEPVSTKLPLAVLVNRGTASASEILAGALQDLDRAVIIGQRTFGKGLVQVPRPVGYGSYLKVTTAKYYIPSGRCIQMLDYSNRNEDGSVGVIPDSLISEFKTKNGRKVYDGGGIMPDVSEPNRYMNRFPAILNRYGHIDDFANDYYGKHTAVPDIHTFEVSDELYNGFIDFMKTREVKYVSATEHSLGKVREYATQENFLSAIGDELSKIEEKVRGDKMKDLLLYKSDIKELLENAIIVRYHYPWGSLERMTKCDPLIAHAAELLPSDEYAGILSSRDTQKNVAAAGNE